MKRSKELIPKMKRRGIRAITLQEAIEKRLKLLFLNVHNFFFLLGAPILFSPGAYNFFFQMINNYYVGWLRLTITLLSIIPSYSIGR